MAGSRLEKIGTIYTRTTGLLRSGALNWQDRPLWYDIYEAFPPKEEPRFDRPIPNMKLKTIFYKEDKIRAMFHRNNKHIGTTNMSNNKYTSLTQRFIETYQKLESENRDLPEEELYKQAIDVLKWDREVRAQAENEEAISLSTAFKEAKSKQDSDQDKIKIDVKDIFK
ncbi:unnamed protein product [Phaedon cochleariae]|uniref:Small ribosomal subunit protein mS23 n=1 Tax=Phaedon cochleariae TaxID=80249 RepID=A0A9P0DJU5_PHACE|nr:unnamed protein product [Phaedon cochleariae]